jgi:hypothetical protein
MITFSLVRVNAKLEEKTGGVNTKGDQAISISLCYVIRDSTGLHY